MMKARLSLPLFLLIRLSLLQLSVLVVTRGNDDSTDSDDKIDGDHADFLPNGEIEIKSNGDGSPKILDDTDVKISDSNAKKSDSDSDTRSLSSDSAAKKIESEVFPLSNEEKEELKIDGNIDSDKKKEGRDRVIDSENDKSRPTVDDEPVFNEDKTSESSDNNIANYDQTQSDSLSSAQLDSLNYNRGSSGNLESTNQEDSNQEFNSYEELLKLHYPDYDSSTHYNKGFDRLTGAPSREIPEGNVNGVKVHDLYRPDEAPHEGPEVVSNPIPEPPLPAIEKYRDRDGGFKEFNSKNGVGGNRYESSIKSRNYHNSVGKTIHTSGKGNDISPNSYNERDSGSVAKITHDSNTGEVLSSTSQRRSLQEQKLRQMEEFNHPNNIATVDGTPHSRRLSAEIDDNHIDVDIPGGGIRRGLLNIHDPTDVDLIREKDEADRNNPDAPNHFNFRHEDLFTNQRLHDDVMKHLYGDLYVPPRDIHGRLLSELPTKGGGGVISRGQYHKGGRVLTALDDHVDPRMSSNWNPHTNKYGVTTTGPDDLECRACGPGFKTGNNVPFERHPKTGEIISKTEVQEHIHVGEYKELGEIRRKDGSVLALGPESDSSRELSNVGSVAHRRKLDENGWKAHGSDGENENNSEEQKLKHGKDLNVYREVFKTSYTTQKGRSMGTGRLTGSEGVTGDMIEYLPGFESKYGGLKENPREIIEIDTDKPVKEDGSHLIKIDLRKNDRITVYRGGKTYPDYPMMDSPADGNWANSGNAREMERHIANEKHRINMEREEMEEYGI